MNSFREIAEKELEKIGKETKIHNIKIHLKQITVMLESIKSNKKMIEIQEDLISEIEKAPIEDYYTKMNKFNS